VSRPNDVIKNYQFGCVDSDEEIPSNISNLEVKLICGEGSARGTWCENSKMHPLYLKKATLTSGLFVFDHQHLFNSASGIDSPPEEKMAKCQVKFESLRSTK
jgi:hypothetical protein